MGGSTNIDPGAGWLIAGLGCRTGCSLGTLLGLVDQALASIGATREALAGLATFERRLGAPALCALARALGLPLVGYGTAALVPFEPYLSHRSVPSHRHTGCYGIAESAALAHCQALGHTRPRLIVTRVSTPYATLALAGGSLT